MRLKPRHRGFYRGLLALLLSTTPFLASGGLWADAQQTGIVAGTLVDGDGEPVAGVEVVIEGPQIERRVVTNAGGRFRFPALGIGLYRLRAELLGLVATASQVVVSVNKTSPVELVLRPPDDGTDVSAGVAEWIRVVAEAPLLDPRETRVGANVRFEFLEDLPVERFYQSVALLLPGVAGGEDGNPNVSGALRSSNLYLIDGVDTTDPTTGLFGLNLAYESIAEVEVTTAAAPIEYGRASGAMINVVTRDGGPELLGLARWVAANHDWNDDYGFSGERTAHLKPEIDAANAGPDRIDSTLSLRLDGPIVRDRWFFAGAWEGGDNSFLRPTEDGELWDEANHLESGAAKLTGQLGDSHTVIAQHTFDMADFVAFAPFARQPGEVRVPQLPDVEASPSRRPGDIFALENRDQDGRFTKGQWYAVWRQNLSMGFNLAHQEREIARRGRNARGFTGDAPHLLIVPTAQIEGEPLAFDLQFVNGVTAEGFEHRPREQVNLTLDYFLSGRRVDHRFTFGVDHQATESETLLQPAGVDGVDRLTGRPTTGQVFVDLDATFECLIEGNCRNPFRPEDGVFLPDSVDNYWLQEPQATREESTAVYLSETMELHRFVIRVGLRLESAKGEGSRGLLVDDLDVAPRIGVTYDLGADGSSLLSAAWGLFYEPFLQQFADAFERSSAFSGLTTYRWDPDPACTTSDPSDLANPCWLASSVSPVTSIGEAEPNTGLERSFVEEVVIGYERELGTGAGLSVHYIDRRWRDLWDDFTVADAVSGTSRFVVGQVPGARRSYKAFQVLVRRRFAERWELLASYTHSAARGNLFTSNGLSTFADFSDVTDTNTSNRFGPAPFDRPNQLGVFGSYLLAFKRFSVTWASAVTYRDGVAFERVTRERPFGIRFLTPRGSERLPGVFSWDLAANLDVRVGAGLKVECKAEVFNVTGESQQLGADSSIDSGTFALPRSLADLQRPRSFRFTLGFAF